MEGTLVVGDSAGGVKGGDVRRPPLRSNRPDKALD